MKLTRSLVLFAFVAWLFTVLPRGLAQQAEASNGPRDTEFPRPKYLGDPAKLGLGIQRTMRLLATSTPEKRNPVRVLFYGQSITEQEWWKVVAADLRARFPHANLIVENRALGGFASQWLEKTAETDLYPAQPDMLIFHVYGAHDAYERIIQRTRERTTAEILIQTDHLGAKDRWKEEERDPAKITHKEWNSFMNYKHLPAVAKKYGAGVVEQREIWKRYLADHQLEPQALLKDGVHLNAHGNFLMAECVKAYLVPREGGPEDPMNTDGVKTFVVGKDLPVQDGRVRLEFTGTRVDAVFGALRDGAAKVMIDGRSPAEVRELFGFTRALAKPGGKWPALTNLSSEALPVVEDWTLEAQRDSADPKRFTFKLRGSLTGPDGEGASDARFVSKSGRVVIAPENWGLDFPLALAGVKPVPDQITIRWSVVPRFIAEASWPKGQAGPEAVSTLMQGLSNGRHTIELTGVEAAGIIALRVYTPTPAKR